MDVIIYHNSNCSKSRQTLKLLEENGITPKIITYLSSPPDFITLKHLLKLLNFSSPRQLLRSGEAKYAANNLSDNTMTDEQIIRAMVKDPILIERPIVVVNNERAVIGRPPEKILEILTDILNE